MKRNRLFVSAIIFVIVVGVACAAGFRGTITAMNEDKSSLAVQSTDDMKEYNFECVKGAIPSDVRIGDNVTVQFKDEGKIRKATKVRKVPTGC